MKKNNRRHVPQPRRIELDYSEKWGKDVEEATRLAIADLKISEDEAIVTVLEQPTKGFLGIGAKLAKVRVEKGEQPAQAERQSAVEPAPAERVPQESAVEPAREAAAEGESLGIGKVRDLRKNKAAGEAGASGGAGRGSAGRSERPRRDRSEGRGGRRERGRGGERGERRDSRGEDREDKGENKGESRSENRAYWISGADRPKRPARTSRVTLGGSDASNKADTQSPAAASGEKPFLNEKPEDLRPVSEGNAAADFFRALVERMGLDITLKASENEECVYLEVEGKDSRTVIGKRGQTLDAIQYLTNLVMNKELDRYVRVIIDVEGYRSRREKTLEHLAVKLAKKVELTGRDVKLEPMNPYERKVIHATLQSNGKISTRSEGEEPYRRVIIERK
ncbi:MAG: protein jag [Clostridiales Family XIII bacterium]|jgi:spoIIIJ-associated protein|nr:protein jag [Clostridiales Family XIII bacterium]